MNQNWGPTFLTFVTFFKENNIPEYVFLAELGKRHAPQASETSCKCKDLKFGLTPLLRLRSDQANFVLKSMGGVELQFCPICLQ